MLQDNRGGWMQGLLGGPDDDLYTEEERKRLQRAQMQAMGSGLLGASGWSSVPITFGQAWADASGQGQAARQHAEQGVMQRRQMTAAADQKKQWEAMLATLPPDQAANLRFLEPKEGAKALADQRAKLELEREKVKGKDNRTTLQKEAEAMFPGDRAKQSAYIQNAREKAGTNVTVGGPGGRVGLISPEEASGLGLPAGTRWQYTKSGTIAPVAGTLPKDMPEDTGGLNDRQRTGIELKATAMASYAEQLTGTPAEELIDMNPEDVRKLIEKKGKRIFQGPVMGDIPYISEAVNRDITPYSSQAASGQAAINNPTGIITEADFSIAEKQGPNPRMPIEVQADIIVKALEELRRVREKKQPQAASMGGFRVIGVE